MSISRILAGILFFLIADAATVHHELFTDSDKSQVITAGIKLDMKLRSMLRSDWKTVLCPNWYTGKLDNEDASWAIKSKLLERGLKVGDFIQLLDDRRSQLEQVGPVKDYDCILHAMTTVTGEMSWVSVRAKHLWHAGHLYEATVLYLFGQVQPWTPFRFIGKTNITIRDILFEHTDDAWAVMASHMSSWGLTWAAAFMQNPVTAQQRAMELARFCELPEDYEGHPSRTTLHHIPNRFTHTWLVHCVQKAIPSMISLGGDINKGFDAENILNEIGMMGNGAPFAEDSVFGGKTVTMALLEAGADPRVPDATGYNTLHLATFWASKTVVRDLHSFRDGEYWQDLINAQDLFGRTPHDIACEAKWVVNAFGEDLMNLLGGECRDGSFTSNNTPEKYCLGSEYELGEDLSFCKARSQTEFQDEEHCDLEVIDASKSGFNMHTFLKHYSTTQRPVVVRNAFVPNPNADLSYIREYLSDALFTQVSVPYAEKYGRKTKSDTRIGDFLDTCMHQDFARRDNSSCSADGKGYYQDYIFEVPRRNNPDNEAIRQIFVENLPSFIDYTYEPKRDGSGSPLGCPQFYSGPNHSGSQMHTHIAAHNMLYEGKKFWWFLPPLLSFTSNIHAVQWRDELVQEQDGILTCTQNAGDIFFVPTHWGHGLLNQADSFGFACEFEWTPWYSQNVLPYALQLPSNGSAF